jgi:pimeloyl-ACP methyl ester carboxylesterase
MPILMVTEKPSAISVTGFAEMMNQFSDNVTFKEVSTIGHWVQLEAADEVNRFLDDFIFSDCVASSLVAA